VPIARIRVLAANRSSISLHSDSITALRLTARRQQKTDFMDSGRADYSP